MECVPLAVATDVAGSIRIPASFCGVVGFKPTPARMSSKGLKTARLNDRVGTGYVLRLFVLDSTAVVSMISHLTLAVDYLPAVSQSRRLLVRLREL
jgi:Asp-tRNA(Asn)/Glu-tRNA(Gln) amidotransferase A subunit family amidase